MKIHTDSGFLVLADVSGFTAFLTTTELEHGPPIIADLLQKVIGRLSPPLEIEGVEGDAVFALGRDGTLVPPSALLDVLDGAFIAFKDRQRALQADDSCSCQACRSVGDLDLKIVVHHGRFLRQMVGTRSQVAGADVVLAHRLLKNGWSRRRAYILLTEAALHATRIDPVRAGLSPHRERLQHFGDVRYFVKDLGAAAALGRAGTRDAWAGHGLVSSATG